MLIEVQEVSPDYNVR